MAKVKMICAQEIIFGTGPEDTYKANTPFAVDEKDVKGFEQAGAVKYDGKEVQGEDKIDVDAIKAEAKAEAEAAMKTDLEAAKTEAAKLKTDLEAANAKIADLEKAAKPVAQAK